MGQLDGKVAAVTGGASGLGRAIAERYVAEGARVVLGDIDDERGRQVAATLGEPAAFRHCDVTREDDVAALVARSAEELGRLDVMVNCAGAIGARGSILDLTAGDFDSTIALLLRSVFFGIKHAGRVLYESGRGGSIVNIASVAALRPGDGPHLYGVAKAGAVHLTQRAALELGERNIRVNCVCPTGVVTPMVLGALGLGADQAAEAEALMAEMQPVPRACTAQDVAAAALWLAGDDSSFVTGQALAVCGGASVGPKWSWQMVK